MALIRCTFTWHNIVSDGYRCPSHSHDCTEIVLSRHSAGLLEQGGRSYAYHHHSVFVYQPGTTHSVINHQDGEHYCIGVVGCQAECLREGVSPGREQSIRHFHEIAPLLGNRSRSRSQQTRLDLLAGLIVCDLQAEQNQSNPAPSNRAQHIRSLLDARLGEPIAFDKLAREVCVSRDYLRQLFRNEFGESMTHYVLRRRLEFAARLLETSRDPVKAIAQHVGFSNEYYFSRAFRQMMGSSPTSWRERSHLAAS